ncbi:hypothetical protein ID866_8225 [Astraeus odoratus]|nr:hypothetical protein ID866_8225 [Astraeus odoratus]
MAAVRFDPFLETLNWNNDPEGFPSPYLLLSHQLDRLVTSSLAVQWPEANSLTYGKLKSVCDNIVCNVNDGDSKHPLKVSLDYFCYANIQHLCSRQIRLVLLPSGDFTTSAAPVPPLRYDPTLPSLFNPNTDSQVPWEPILKIHIDTQPTTDTVFMKTTNRRPYDNARVRAGMPPLGVRRDNTSNCPDDVILYNIDGAVTETSICNIAFYRGGKWITPPLTVGCISGVFRRWLLENNRIHEAEANEISRESIIDNEWALVFNGVMGCRLGRVHVHAGQDGNS